MEASNSSESTSQPLITAVRLLTKGSLLFQGGTIRHILRFLYPVNVRNGAFLTEEVCMGFLSLERAFQWQLASGLAFNSCKKLLEYEIIQVLSYPVFAEKNIDKLPVELPYAP